MGCITSKESFIMLSCLPDVHLPKDDEFSNWQAFSHFFQLTNSDLEVIDWTLSHSNEFAFMKGKKKNDLTACKPFHDQFVREVIQKDGAHNILPKEYKYFGTDDPKRTLITLIKNNPFYASSLVKTNEGYSITSYDNNENKSDSKYTRACNFLTDDYKKVNAKFSNNIELESIQVFNKKGEIEEKSEDRSCLYLLHTMSYYAQLIHAVFHIWNWLLVSGMGDSICELENNHSLRAFGRSYIPNVVMKNEQVDMLLLGDNCNLTGDGYKVKDPVETPNKIREFCREILVIFGKCTNVDEFYSSFLLKDSYNNGTEELKNNGILVEHFKHMELVPRYANDLCKEFKKMNDSVGVGKLEKNFEVFYSRCGKDIMSNCRTLDSWIQQISIIGITHSSTMSFTRVCCSQSSLSVWTDSDTFGDVEVNMAVVFSGTIVGTDEHQTMFNNRNHTWKNMNPMILNIMNSYRGISSNYKKEYFEKISEDQKELCENGWLLSDFFPEVIDGKQFTLTTYI
jgi:hypothetical protein